MLRAQLGQRAGSLGGQTSCPAPSPVCCRRPIRSGLKVFAVGDFFKKAQQAAEKLTGGNKSGGGSGGNDAAKKALQGTFNDPKKYGKNFFGQQGERPKQDAGGGGGGAGGFSGFGGGGGGGSSGFSGAGDAGQQGPFKTIAQQFMELLQITWTVFWNMALFLGFADMLHRSLDWCASIELLLLIGAPQQAWERVGSCLFGMLEWAQRSLLGWDVPGEADGQIHQYANIRDFYPEQHAYTFDQYRYNLTDAEKKTLCNAYALRHYERQGGRPGDVEEADLAAILKRHNPVESDRRAFQEAKASGNVEGYWAQEANKAQYKALTKRDFQRPPGSAAPPAMA